MNKELEWGEDPLSVEVLCNKCGSIAKWIGTMRIGLYSGGVALFECPKCKTIIELDVKEHLENCKSIDEMLKECNDE